MLVDFTVAGVTRPALSISLSLSSCSMCWSLKDQLRDKDQHIEQLLKEREMERAEVAKAAGQTDQVESKLIKVTEELTAFKTEVSVSREDNIKLRVLLEEEKKKVE